MSKRNFRTKLATFMRGRYGTDKLNRALLILYIIISVLSMLIAPIVGSAFFSIALIMLSALTFISIFYRMFSRNIAKRRAENKAYLNFTGNLKNRFKDRKTHVYRKCPKCGARLRLPRVRGKHTVNCPKCQNRFKVRGRGIF